MRGMDSRWQPTLDHPPSGAAFTAEARGLFAAGWIATRDECRLVHPGEMTEQLVSTETWRALRELATCMPVQVVQQEA